MDISFGEHCSAPPRPLTSPQAALRGHSGALPRPCLERLGRERRWLPLRCEGGSGGSSRPLSSCQAVDSLINTQEERCQDGKSTLGTSAWHFPKPKRRGERGCHLRGLHDAVTFHSGVQTVDRNLTPIPLLPRLSAAWGGR